MKNHVTSLELSKKLKELGVEQKSHFYWGENIKKWSIYYGLSMPVDRDHVKQEDFYQWKKDNSYSAFLASELGEKLPKSNPHSGNRYILQIAPTIGRWRAGYGRLHFDGITMPDAMAKMLIHLIDNKLITL